MKNKFDIKVAAVSIFIAFIVIIIFGEQIIKPWFSQGELGLGWTILLTAILGTTIYSLVTGRH